MSIGRINIHSFVLAAAGYICVNSEIRRAGSELSNHRRHRDEYLSDTGITIHTYSAVVRRHASRVLSVLALEALWRDLPYRYTNYYVIYIYIYIYIYTESERERERERVCC